VERTALLRRLIWMPATIAEIRAETETASTLVLGVPDWPGHLAGQHVDLRLTAADGYSTQRSYSIASPGMPLMAPLEITVQRVPDGEVSPYLVDVARTGDRFEVRGPVGGYFTWEPGDKGPVLAIGGGSGVVPLMAMARTHAGADSDVPFRLIYSVRGPDEVFYSGELEALRGIDVEHVYTRVAPPGWTHSVGRLDADRLAKLAPPASEKPRVYVCGPTGFVEAVANALVDAGHDPMRIRTERFGPTGDSVPTGDTKT
jgi:ferredoxin-NADP reductase